MAVKLSCAVFLLWCALPILAQAPPSSGGEGMSAEATAAEPAAGPSLASISGTVLDGSGAAIVGARITVTVGAGSAKRETLTGGDGQFSFAHVAPGSYQITVATPGFAPQTWSVVLHAGDAYVAPATVLGVATATTQVNVVPSQAELAEDQVKVEEKQRILTVFPNFYVSYQPDPLPLTPKQKLELAWKTMTDPASLVLTGVTAGVQQGQGAFADYDQGAAGFGRRFGASYGDAVLDTFIGSALLPAVLKQDPRYFYQGTGSVRARMLHAVESVVVCRGDNKRLQPNYSNLMGSLAAGGLSNLYYPASERGASLTFENTLTGLGTGAMINVLQEFVIPRFTRHGGKDAAQPNSAAVPK